MCQIIVSSVLTIVLSGIETEYDSDHGVGEIEGILIPLARRVETLTVRIVPPLGEHGQFKPFPQLQQAPNRYLAWESSDSLRLEPYPLEMSLQPE